MGRIHGSDTFGRQLATNGDDWALQDHGRIGSGSFATVYQGQDDTLDVPVAVKVLADNWATNDDVRARFLAEARLLRRLSDERVVRVYDIGTTDRGQPYFVMDLANGGSLEQLRKRMAPPGLALRLAAGEGRPSARGAAPQPARAPRRHPRQHPADQHPHRRSGHAGRPGGRQVAARRVPRHHDGGNPRLHGPRAGELDPTGPALRHLLARVRDLRAAYRAPPVPGEDPCRAAEPQPLHRSGGDRGPDRGPGTPRPGDGLRAVARPEPPPPDRRPVRGGARPACGHPPRGRTLPAAPHLLLGDADVAELAFRCSPADGIPDQRRRKATRA